MATEPHRRRRRAGIALALAVALAAGALVLAQAAGGLAGNAGPAGGSAATHGAAHAAAGKAGKRAGVPRPRIRKRLIPYGDSRRSQMAAYSRRHYDEASSALVKPKLIVIHYAVAGTVSSIFNTFAANRPDPEYGELPGVCSHYAVGGRGEVVRFVPDAIRCRHVVGLNHVALGIEHVGFSDRDVLSNKRELKASLRLTRWLRCRNGIPVKQVIGHNESLRSRFYRERVPAFKGKTHGDFPTRAMRVYRKALRKLGPC